MSCREHEWPFDEPARIAERMAKKGENAKVASTPAVGGGVSEHVKEGTLYFCCAELYPPHEETYTKATFRGIPPSSHASFLELVKSVLICAGKDDVVIVSDGRSESIRKDIRASFSVKL